MSIHVKLRSIYDPSKRLTSQFSVSERSSVKESLMEQNAVPELVKRFFDLWKLGWYIVPKL
ncbi:hypothetical protein LTR95_017393 [Oleoguttula sp. CCFEE 5521]